jgi:hypothetical protein
VSRTAALVLASVVLVPASAGAGTTRPALGLTATPARVALAGSSQTTVRVTNPGSKQVVVDVARAGFALDLRGRPRIVAKGGRPGAAPWLTARPRRFALLPGASRALTISARLPRAVEPGDHDALVLLTTRPRRGGAVGVRMRIGLVVVVRAPGRVVRRLEVRGLRVRRSQRGRMLEIQVANRGNVTERLARGQVQLVLRRGAAAARLRAVIRELRPRTNGLVQVPYHGPLRGWVSARAEIAAQPGRRAVARTFRVKL